MRVLIIMSVLIIVVVSQQLTYNSMLCFYTGISGSSIVMKSKYKQFVDNLNRDKTVRAQKSRAKSFITNNIKELKSITSTVVSKILFMINDYLQARWRMVNYLKGLLKKMKPILAAKKFAEIQNSLWKLDVSNANNMYETYSPWKTKTLNSITNSTIRQEISDIIKKYETSDEKKKNGRFSVAINNWRSLPGFQGCTF